MGGLIFSNPPNERKQLAEFKKRVRSSANALANYQIRLNREAVGILAKLVQHYIFATRKFDDFNILKKNKDNQIFLIAEKKHLDKLKQFYFNYSKTHSVDIDEGFVASIEARSTANSLQRHKLGMKETKYFQMPHTLKSLKQGFTFNIGTNKRGIAYPLPCMPRNVLFVMAQVMKELNDKITNNRAASAILEILVACGVEEEPGPDELGKAIKRIGALIGKKDKHTVMQRYSYRPMD